jgi:localization factor PodJL
LSRRDGKARMPWSVKGVSAEARELAKSATAREGDTMGQWLSDVIRRVGAAQAAGRPVGVAHHRRTVPAVGAPAVGAPGAGGRPAAGGTVPAAAPGPAAAPADSVDEEVLATLIAERVERSETRLVGLLHSLEDIVGRLADRLDHLERSLDDADRGPPRSLPPR